MIVFFFLFSHYRPLSHFYSFLFFTLLLLSFIILRLPLLFVCLSFLPFIQFHYPPSPSHSKTDFSTSLYLGRPLPPAILSLPLSLSSPISLPPYIILTLPLSSPSFPLSPSLFLSFAANRQSPQTTSFSPTQAGLYHGHNPYPGPLPPPLPSPRSYRTRDHSWKLNFRIADMFCVTHRNFQTRPGW